MDALAWDTWKTIGSAEKLDAATRACEAVRAKGIRLGVPELAAFGPEGATHSVAVVEDLGTGVFFALVPGGTLRVGLSEAALAAYWNLQRGWLTRLDDRREYEQPYPARGWSPAQLTGYRRTTTPARRLALVGREPPRDTRVSVDVAPLFVAIQPLTARALGVTKPTSALRPLMGFEEAEAAAERLGYSLPSSHELEWSTRGDGDGLFVWGDDLPTPMDPREPVPASNDAWQDGIDAFETSYLRLARTPIATWPTSGPFGLQGAGGEPVWCRGARGEALVAGGAARLFPWRGGGEWLWLIPSLRVEASTIDLHEGAMLRPVVRIV